MLCCHWYGFDLCCCAAVVWPPGAWKGRLGIWLSAGHLDAWPCALAKPRSPRRACDTIRGNCPRELRTMRTCLAACSADNCSRTFTTSPSALAHDPWRKRTQVQSGRLVLPPPCGQQHVCSRITNYTTRSFALRALPMSSPGSIN